ncbi:glutathione S-transferase family protein [uncultured Aureimonas sp.]|uniref:glutathione S-transferase family protein n=1 Tax=uncultured Aureimonas sp. TaxID=1604662 RepID=UPI0025E24DDA|nr:glutathione S-transferase [uncultured Aureimonas sp.]
MRLLYSKPSPYSSKVRMAAHLCDLDIELVPTNTADEGAELIRSNPIGKIPALILDDGSTLYDSRVICEYLDRLGGNPIIPQAPDAWAATKRVEALADGMTEAAMAALYEKRYRPKPMWYEPWMEKQWRRAHRALDALEHEVEALPETPTLAHLAVASDLAWVQLRFPEELNGRHPALAAWLDRFFESHPDLAALKPVA